MLYIRAHTHTHTYQYIHTLQDIRVHTYIYIFLFFFLWCCGPTRAMAFSFLKFLDHTQRPTTVGTTPLDELSARRRVLYLTKHNTHNREISMPPAKFEPTISASEWPQTYTLDRVATGTSTYIYTLLTSTHIHIKTT